MSKKVLIIDLRAWNWTGIGRVTRGIFESTKSLYDRFELIYIISDGIDLPSGEYEIFVFKHRPFSIGEQIEYWQLLKKFKDRKIILHLINFNIPLIISNNVKLIIHFYEVLYGTGELRSLKHLVAYAFIMWRIRKNRAIVLAQSEYTRKQISRHHPFFKVIVSPHGFSSYLNKEVVDLYKIYELNSPFFLYVGLNRPRKNLDGLLRSYRSGVISGENIHYDLVICGPIFDAANMCIDLKAAVKDDPVLKNRVHLLGFVPESHLHSIYSQASLLIVPSHIEGGYSYPALEALSTGTPVLLNEHDMFSFCADGIYFFSEDSGDGQNCLTARLMGMLVKNCIPRINPDHNSLLKSLDWQNVANQLNIIYDES